MRLSDGEGFMTGGWYQRVQNQILSGMMVRSNGFEQSSRIDLETSSQNKQQEKVKNSREVGDDFGRYCSECTNSNFLPASDLREHRCVTEESPFAAVIAHESSKHNFSNDSYQGARTDRRSSTYGIKRSYTTGKTEDRT